MYKNRILAPQRQTDTLHGFCRTKNIYEQRRGEKRVEERLEKKQRLREDFDSDYAIQSKSESSKSVK